MLMERIMETNVAMSTRRATSKFLGQMRLLRTEDVERQCDRGLPYLEVIVPV
jgi:hypothetical protein